MGGPVRGFLIEALVKVAASAISVVNLCPYSPSQVCDCTDEAYFVYDVFLSLAQIGIFCKMSKLNQEKVK